MKWDIQPLGPQHERASFTSGHDQLDSYIRHLAGQHAKKNISRTFVGVIPGQSVVAGYYSMAGSSASFKSAPVALTRKLPAYPLPLLLLGRLAVDSRYRGEGLGRLLLVHAFRGATLISEHAGILGVEVHAIDETARQFYLRHGFETMADSPKHLLITMSTIKSVLKDVKY